MSLCVCVCLSVYVFILIKMLELSTPNMIDIRYMVVIQHALSVRSKGKVKAKQMSCVTSVGVQVDRTA